MDQNLLHSISVCIKSTISDQINDSRELFHIIRHHRPGKNTFTWASLFFLFCVAKLFLKTCLTHIILNDDADQNDQYRFTSGISLAKWILFYSVAQLP